ncbi:MAG: mannose-6-phosphate isomerase [Planctomycetota bacterium]|jgi:mannose-6-phosphate isomerase
MNSVPIRFERIFLEKVWGGRNLATAPGFELPPETMVGETWEVVDREQENSVAAEGAPAGTTLRQLLETDAQSILGVSSLSSKGRFPLLVKYIDASLSLSIQVHPDDEAALRLGNGSEGKTEAWYILAAEPGAAIYSGLKPGVTREQFEASTADGTVEQLLQRFEIKAGDCITILGGTVHAIGAGVTLLEVQQNSDTTYRVWDWGRMGLDGAPRETHLRQALEVIAFDQRSRPPVNVVGEPVGETLLRARQSHTDYFALDTIEVRGSAEFSTRNRFEILVVVDGTGILESADGQQRLSLSRGETWLIPASIGEYRLSSTSDAISLVSLTDGSR